MFFSLFAGKEPFGVFSPTTLWRFTNHFIINIMMIIIIIV